MITVPDFSLSHGEMFEGKAPVPVFLGLNRSLPPPPVRDILALPDTVREFEDMGGSVKKSEGD